MDILQTVVAGLLGGGLIGFLEFLIRRRDAKNDKHDEILKRLDSLDQEMKNIKAEEMEHNAVLARTHILRFSDELYNGTHHSKEYFEQTLDDIATYNRFCGVNPEFANGRTKMAAEFIEETYKRLYMEHKL